MNAKQLDEVVHKTQELIKTPTCCQELKEMAEVHSRSVNKEIEHLIKEALKKYRQTKGDEFKTRKKTRN